MSQLAEFIFARTHKQQFSQFLRSIIKCFHPNKKDFHQELFLFLKNGAVLYFGLIIVQNAKNRLRLLVSWPLLLKTLFKFRQEGGGASLFIPELLV